MGKNFQISYPNFPSSDLGKNSQISYPKFSADLNLGKISYPFGLKKTLVVVTVIIHGLGVLVADAECSGTAITSSIFL